FCLSPVLFSRRPEIMKRILLLTFLLLTLLTLASAVPISAQTGPVAVRTTPETKTAKAGIKNPAIDMKGYLEVAEEAAKHRESRRLTEEEFISMSREFGVIILD